MGIGARLTESEERRLLGQKTDRLRSRATQARFPERSGFVLGAALPGALS
jgi:hypothetical protein